MSSSGFDGKIAEEELNKQFAAVVSEKPCAEIVELDSSLSVRDAVRRLVHSTVLAAPVYDAEGKRYVGWVDTRDLTAHIVKVHSDGPHKHRLDLSSSLMRTRAAESRPVSALVDLSHTNEFRPITADAPLGSVLTILSGGVHRIPVVDTATCRVVKVISQSDIVRFLADRTELLRGVADRTLSELEVGSGPVESIPSDAPPMEAFRIMNAKRLSALPVVDAHTGAIVTNVSASDIKHMLKHEKFGFMERTVLDFVSSVRQASVDDMIAAVVAKPSDTLEHVIAKLAACKVHRVYVVDDHRRPVSVVSLKDILARLHAARS